MCASYRKECHKHEYMKLYTYNLIPLHYFCYIVQYTYIQLYDIFIRHAKFFLIDIPNLSAPLQPTFFQKCTSSAVLSWTPPIDSSCITTYTLTLTNITDEGNTSRTYNTTTNTTHITLLDLTKGAEYYFIVAGVDAEGRVGEESVASEIVKLKCQCLQVIKTNVIHKIFLTLQIYLHHCNLPSPLSLSLQLSCHGLLQLNLSV